MSILFVSVDAHEAVINMRMGSPKPARPEGSATVNNKKVMGIPMVENWEEGTYSGPSSEICYVATQDLCLNCIKSLRNSIGEKFTRVMDHGTFSEAINAEIKKPTTIVGNDPVTGDPITAEDVAKKRTAVTDADKSSDPAVNPAMVDVPDKREP